MVKYLKYVNLDSILLLYIQIIFDQMSILL